MKQELREFMEHNRQAVEADRRNGVARVGGTFWDARYARSYFRAADVLLGSKEVSESLNDFVLPLLYLQRHALEVLIKTAIDACAYLADERIMFDSTAPPLKEAEFGHSLSKNFRILSEHLGQLGYDVPTGVVEVIAKIDAIEEEKPDRLRYSTVEEKVAVKGKKPEKIRVASFPNEKEVPIRGLQEEIRSIFRGLADDEGSLLQNLSDECESLFQRALREGKIRI